MVWRVNITFAYMRINVAFIPRMVNMVAYLLEAAGNVNLNV